MSDYARDFCREILNEVSRSFALTIPMLDEKIRDFVTIVYLQDRLLDNFEDELPDIDNPKRQKLMDKVVKIFDPAAENAPSEVKEIQQWSDEFADPSLEKLTENTDLLWQAYNSLDPDIKNISYRWLQEMNQGMKKYLVNSVDTFAELDEYCYYVAGTVGGFLTDLIIHVSEMDDNSIKSLRNNYSQAGKFLQKVNIIRDIRADVVGRNRIFWPLVELDVTAQELIQKNNRAEALTALEKMLASAVQHVPALFKYMQAIPDTLPGYRKFYSVNNALGLATLNLLKDNHNVFISETPLKIPRWKTFLITKFPEKYMKKYAEPYL